MLVKARQLLQDEHQKLYEAVQKCQRYFSICKVEEKMKREKWLDVMVPKREAMQNAIKRLEGQLAAVRFTHYKLMNAA